MKVLKSWLPPAWVIDQAHKRHEKQDIADVTAWIHEYPLPSQAEYNPHTTNHDGVEGWQP
jgi:hypothetical protein